MASRGDWKSYATQGLVPPSLKASLDWTTPLLVWPHQVNNQVGDNEHFLRVTLKGDMTTDVDGTDDGSIISLNWAGVQCPVVS